MDQFPKLWGQPLNEAQSRLRMVDRQFHARLSDTNIRISNGSVQPSSVVPMSIDASVGVMRARNPVTSSANVQIGTRETGSVVQRRVAAAHAEEESQASDRK